MSKLTAQHVITYLQQHPDFLIGQPQLLAQLELQQKTQGAISLVHIQQRQLREHNTALKHQIATMAKHAEQNELVYRLFSLCHRQLWSSYDFNTLASNLRSIICTSPAINECKLVKYAPEFNSLIAHRFNHSGHYLGRVNQQERELLFNKNTQSSAIYLIGDTKNPLAILAFGSDDETHFEPTQDNLFVLDFIRSLQVRLLELA